MNATVYHVCDDCFAAITGEDFSSVDLDVDRVETFLDWTGDLTDAGMVPKDGYWSASPASKSR